MEVLETRLRSRGTDSNEVIEKRLRNAREEISHASEFDYTIVNNDLDDAFIEFCEILEKELGV
jgi:guanylate kinase